MSEQVNQREATYNAIKSVLKFSDGDNIKERFTSDLKKQTKSILFEGFRSGTITSSESFQSKTLKDDSKLNAYCNGLISNWAKKDKRMNGGVQHKIQNPGSRAGQGDETIKELRKLAKQVAGTDAESEVQAALDARVVEVKAAKTPTLTINTEAIPEHLRHLVK